MPGDVMDLFRLNQKTALVTGGSRGLGREMALALAEAGADVVITGRTRATLDACLAEITARGRRGWGLVGDLSDPADAERVCQQALEFSGGIDILIANVGNREDATPSEQVSTQTWLDSMNLNVTSTFVACRTIGADLIARGRPGRIITISSMSALVNLRGQGGRHYEAGKAAVLQLTRSLAADWAPYQITVNSILPGLFMTDANREWNEKKPELIEAITAQIPLGRAGDPPEIGPLAVYLASEASSYMTGSAIVIDGGFTLW